MMRSFKPYCKILPLCLLLCVACRKREANIEVSFCNGGMVPDTVTFTESNIGGADYIWQWFTANGTALSGPTQTGSTNSIFARIDSAGSYKVNVDVNNKYSAEVDFTVENYVADGSQRAVSFFDNNFVLWTVYPDSDCRAAVRVKEVNGVGGIDYYAAENKLFYVANGEMFFCFPNGEDLDTLISTTQSFTDISIEQTTGNVFLGTFGGFILQTTVANLSIAVTNDQYDEQYPVDQSIGQLTFRPQGNTFYFTDGSTSIFSREAVLQAPTNQGDFGSALIKTAIAYDVRNNRLYFAEGSSPCTIVGVNPDQPNQRLFTRQVPCDGFIQGMDVDEEEMDIVYTDGENVWLIRIDNQSAPIALVTDPNKTIQKDNLDFSDPVVPPVGDVVIAKYND